MKGFTVYLLAAVVGQVNSSSEPLVSLDSVSNLVVSSVELGADLVKFGSSKLQESLSGEPRKVYDKFVVHADNYKTMVVKWYAESSVTAGVTENVLKPVIGVLKGRYDAFNKLNHQYLDPIVEDFEARYPSSTGLLGSELVDRALVIVWMYMCLRYVLGIMCRGCCNKNRQVAK
jgi:hypothetical protein